MARGIYKPIDLKHNEALEQVPGDWKPGVVKV